MIRVDAIEQKTKYRRIMRQAVAMDVCRLGAGGLRQGGNRLRLHPPGMLEVANLVGKIPAGMGQHDVQPGMTRDDILRIQVAPVLPFYPRPETHLDRSEGLGACMMRSFRLYRLPLGVR